MSNSQASVVLKRELRKRLRAQLAALSADAITAESAAVCSAVMTDARWTSAKTVGLYASMAAELDTSLLLGDAFANGKRVFLPRVISKAKHDMRMLETRNLAELQSWTPNGWGIREPPLEGRADAPADAALDVLIVPGLAFDALGRRCGRGAGFYDSYLARYTAARGAPPHTIAPALAVQLVDVVPVSEFDVPIDRVFTVADVRSTPG